MKRIMSIVTAISLVAALCVGPAYAVDVTPRTVGDLTFGSEVPQADIDALTPAQLAVLEKEAIGPVVGLYTVEGGTGASDVAPFASSEQIPASDMSITFGVTQDATTSSIVSFRVVAMATWKTTRSYNFRDYIGLTWDPFFTLNENTHEAYTYYNKNGDTGFSNTDGSDNDSKCRLANVDGNNGLSYAVLLTQYDQMVVIAATLSESSASGRDGTSMFWTACAYMHCFKEIQVSGVTLSVSASPSFDVSMSLVDKVAQRSGYYSKRYES